MRILQVRFKNLNSLAGEWEIDLTQPAYTADGIFAITGPTGAGKTTILDAICLALYGRTPRLNKITKSGNEIMSRQTGECFAEVTFETQVGRFRCHWSQHRSRKKSDGELQAPKHEIANADTGEIFESKMRGVADHIESVTGMDFDRFTRSMLLAQGGFAAFLQAAPDERAPILEQITGTEIYSQISIGLNVRGGRSVELKQNYRNTKQIAEAALSLLSHDPQNSDFSEHLLPHREGPVPIVKHVNGSASQYSELIKILSKIDLSNETVVFLHRNRRGVENILSSLKQKNFKCINIISSPSEDIKPAGIYGCTMSSIKGLEFDHVIICDLNDDILPYPGGFTDENDELHISTERRLLYTCMTRARKGLILLSTGKPCRYFQEIDRSKVEVHSAHPL